MPTSCGSNSHACCQANEEGTPLHKAAFEGHQELVELLSEKDVKINLQNTAGRTALMRAREAGQAKMASVLRNQGTKIRGTREKRSRETDSSYHELSVELCSFFICIPG